ncbi:hypothetical protein D9M68_307040 [compost metagenome]
MKTRLEGNPASRHWTLKPLCLGVALAMTAGLSLAGELPTGGEVISGQGTIGVPNGNELRIDTHTPRTAINWKKFSIGADGKVHFQQPDGSSVVLNRVIGGEGSHIFGMLTSNGRLVLLNPNGIWLGRNSRISAASLTAAAGTISDEQMKKFAETGKIDVQLQGLVRNEGTINIEPKGMAVLLGAQVENAGIIRALEGQAVLATGPRATLDFTGDGLISLAVAPHNDVQEGLEGGVHNTGHIQVGNGVVAMSAQKAADHLNSVINLGGTVMADSVSEKGGSIFLGNSQQTNVSGTLSAKGTDGGSIKVLGDQVNVAGSAKLDASGTAGSGGKVLVGGNFQGQGGEPAARTTTVAKGAELKADGTKDGGLVVAWSDKNTHFAGSASAKGGQKGGVVETSGEVLTVTKDAKVDTSGSAAMGTWLLDPKHVTIVDSGANMTPDDTTDPAITEETGTVAASAITEGLKTGDVRIYATESITVDAPIIAQVIGKVTIGGVDYPATLVLQADGKVGELTAYDDSNGKDIKSNSSGTVDINAPILLKDGDLFISATGDVKLNDKSAGKTGDDAYKSRGIVDVGKGTVWIATSDTASVTQDANTALIGDKVAVKGASVVLNSPLNHAGTLAGAATNGVFEYNQTNATGAVDTGKVTSRYSGQSMDDVSVRQIKFVERKEYDSRNNGQNPDITIAASNGGQEFDHVIFEAGKYKDANGNYYTDADSAMYADSSDYLVRFLMFDLGGESWRVTPVDGGVEGGSIYVVEKLVGGNYETATQADLDLLAGFGFSANKGKVISFNQNPYYGWGVSGFDNPGGTTNQGEIQHRSKDGASEQLVVALGGKVTELDTNLHLLLSEGGTGWQGTPNKPAHETAVVTLLNTEKGTAQLTANKATVTAQADDQTRVYGDANPPLTTTADMNEAAKAVRDLDQFVDNQLGRSGITAGDASTDATPRSNVGDYAIKHGYALDEFSSKRYEATLGDGTLTIVPAPLVVKAHDQSKQVGEADPALTYETHGWKFDEDKQAFVMDRTPGEAPGTYAIFDKDKGLIANYIVTYLDGKLTIAGPVSPPPGPNPDPDPAPGPNPDPGKYSMPVTVQGPGSERCTALESPAAVSANYTVSPAVARTYAVQLICKPRAYDHATAEEQLPDVSDILSYANTLLKDGRFQIPDWNRSVIPREPVLDNANGKK